MKLIKRGHMLPPVWEGRCRKCFSLFEDSDENVKREGAIEMCPRQGYRFAHRDCPECGAKAGFAAILYPKAT
jgi:hypothetical protein